MVCMNSYKAAAVVCMNSYIVCINSYKAAAVETHQAWYKTRGRKQRNLNWQVNRPHKQTKRRVGVGERDTGRKEI